MRIIAGSLGGRTFNAPHGHKTHPMSERVRGGLFNALGDLDGLTVLDAYAGSGALGLEAISRGAAYVTTVESDSTAHRTIEENIHSFQLQDKMKLIRAKVAGWLQTDTKSIFDIVLADPPYNRVQEKTLETLATRVKVGGVVVYSLPPNIRLILPTNNFERLTMKSYGDATLVFYRRLQ